MFSMYGFVLKSFLVTPGRAANWNPPLNTSFATKRFPYYPDIWEYSSCQRVSCECFAVIPFSILHFPYSTFLIPREGRTITCLLSGHHTHWDLCRHQWLCSFPEPLSLSHPWNSPTGTCAIRSLIPKACLVPRDVPKDQGDLFWWEVRAGPSLFLQNK